LDESVSSGAAKANEKWLAIKKELTYECHKFASETSRLRQKAFVVNGKFLLQSLDQSNAKEFLLNEGKKLVKMLGTLLPEASGELQKGKDLQAMGVIEMSVEMFALLCSLLGKTKSLASTDAKAFPGFEPFFENIKLKLKELEEAFVQSDFILLSDLLEYELVELLPEAEKALQEIVDALP
jgi:hypothetical protein